MDRLPHSPEPLKNPTSLPSLHDLSERASQAIKAAVSIPENITILNLGVCEALGETPTLTPLAKMTLDIHAVSPKPSSFGKAQEILRILKAFQDTETIKNETEGLLTELINGQLIPLCKQGFIPLKELKKYAAFMPYISEEHLRPQPTKLLNPSHVDLINSLFLKLLNQDPSLEHYDENGILALLQNHILNPFSEDYLRFIESNLIDEATQAKLGPRPIVYSFLSHFINQTEARILPLNTSLEEKNQICLLLSLISKNLASLLVVYTDAPPFVSSQEKNQKALTHLLHQGIDALHSCNQSLWILLRQDPGFYIGVYIDNFIYTLTTVLDFSHLFKDDLLQTLKAECTGPFNLDFKQINIISETKQKLNTLILAFRFGIYPLKPEMKNEGVADQIEEFLSQFPE